MHQRRVLIIDDDEVVQSLYRRTLTGIDPDLDIATATNGAAAVHALQENQFDIVLADLTLLEMDGNLVFKCIQSTQAPDSRLVVSAYGSTDLGQHTSQLNTPYILYKPIDLNKLNHTLVEIFNARKKMRVDHFSLTEDLYQKINRELAGLKDSTNARCILVSDTFGRVLVTVGDTAGIPIDAVTSLLGGGVATLLEAGQSLDDGEDVINLAYREGKKADLYAVNIGRRLLLILVIDRGLFYNRLGTAWFYTRQTVINLNRIFQEGETGQAAPVQQKNASAHRANLEDLDRLFKDG